MEQGSAIEQGNPSLTGICPVVGIWLRTQGTVCQTPGTGCDPPGTERHSVGMRVELVGTARKEVDTVAAKTGPTIRRMQLGQELRRLREQADGGGELGRGITRGQAVKGTSVSESTLHRVERGLTSLPRVQDLKSLLKRYGVSDPGDIEFLLDIHKNSLNRGWWSPYRLFMPSGFNLSVGLEGDAKILRIYQPDVMFGLFQTASYARAQFESAKPVDERNTEFVERNIEIRMRRKEAITRSERPVEIHAILDEAVLRRVYGGPEVMREQYEHLAELAVLDNVTVQILPMSQPVYRSGQNFILMEFEPPLPTVVSVDGFSAVNVTDKDTEIWAYKRRFDAMRADAGGPRATHDFLKRAERELEQS
ncbi:helix-turn-helix domain-containing protein [Streptomyces sp. NBC_01485]|uniref:helix-turn-helix domain-containing protein n=1 Tax=Streptomyces sp. NBC_01485 TaxID=2903884 RepID=UPI002E377FD8|nr:helix-turn-helix transcriptional regulator [Streptomyces sp. NBC_01485]